MPARKALTLSQLRASLVAMMMWKSTRRSMQPGIDNSREPPIVALMQTLRLSLLAVACVFSGCGTVSDLVVTSVPHFKEGKTSIVVRKRAQKADLYKGRALVAVAHISTGREGYGTPVGNFRVIRKDQDHRSGLYGDYVDADDQVVKANVDVRRGGRPKGSRFLGAPMPFYLEFSPGYGLHAGNLPGYPASHGCVRLSFWKARQFFNESRIGTPVRVRP